jgi:hypothetical protein
MHRQDLPYLSVYVITLILIIIYVCDPMIKIGLILIVMGAFMVREKKLEEHRLLQEEYYSLMLKPTVDRRFSHTKYKNRNRGEGTCRDVDARFGRGETIKNLFYKTGGRGDNHLARRSLYLGSQSARAADIRSRAHRGAFQKWFDDGELEMQENSIWWENTDDLYSRRT